MKHLSHVLVCSVAFWWAATTQGQQTFTFTEAVDTSWYNPSNWVVGGETASTVPGEQDHAIIGPHPSTAGQHYNVQYSTDLFRWYSATDFSATGPLSTYTDLRGTAVPPPRRYYRLR